MFFSNEKSPLNCSSKLTLKNNFAKFLWVKSISILLVALFFQTTNLQAATRRYSTQEESQIALNEMRDSIEFIRHEISNREVEMQMLAERVNNQEATIDSLRLQSSTTAQASKEQMKSGLTAIEVKTASLESANKMLVADINQMKTHANETAAALIQYQQHIGELEKVIAFQNQNIDNLQLALRSMMDAMQVKESVSTSETTDGSSKKYRIKSGDSLEKIARAHNTSVRAIKELNRLTDDKIVVGRVLQLP